MAVCPTHQPDPSIPMLFVQPRSKCIGSPHLVGLWADLRVHKLAGVGDVLLEQRNRKRRAVVLGACLWEEQEAAAARAVAHILIDFLILPLILLILIDNDKR